MVTPTPTPPPKMSYAEARQIIRKHYDSWQAAGRLHEVLEKAEGAESFLATVDRDIKAKEAKLKEISTQVTKSLAESNAKLVKLATDEQAKMAGLERSHKDKVMAYSKIESDYQLQLDRMKAEVNQAGVDRDKQLGNMLDEIQKIMAKRDKLQAELDGVKSKFAELVK